MEVPIFGKLLCHLSIFMKSKPKYIGIESTIHVEVLEAVIAGYLKTSQLDQEVCLKHIRQFNKGINRSGKILKHIRVLLSKNKNILSMLKLNLQDIEYFQLNMPDRIAIDLCLFCLTFPISYDVLCAFGQGFKVQEDIHKQVIQKKIGSLYGGNRAMHIAVNEVLAFLVEIRLIKRVSIGIYKPGEKLKFRNPVISELVVYTDIQCSRSKSILVSDLHHRPWYMYFEDLSIQSDTFTTLVTMKDSIPGEGYLTVKKR